jgi:hypothetical protein
MENLAPSTLLHDFYPFFGLKGTNQHSRGKSLPFGNDIQHPMHPIGKINVGMPSPSIHYRGARGAARLGMTGLVIFTNIGFGLCDKSGKSDPLPKPYQATSQ